MTLKDYKRKICKYCKKIKECKFEGIKILENSNLNKFKCKNYESNVASTNYVLYKNDIYRY